MARPLKYGEKTSVRSVTMPDSMWANLPEPKSQWVVEAVRQMLTFQADRAMDDLVAAVENPCRHKHTLQVTKGTKCVDCGEFV